MTQATGFAELVAHWQVEHGRQHLPWQNTRDPYRVWLSEIMLQQTQVRTVMGYYARFLQAFPTVKALAEGSEDAVMAQWSGLGYYTRARNLHRCAKVVFHELGGEFPPSAQQLAALPGIGRSTANAIAAFCYGERVAILDANVRRVLSRVLAFDGDLAKATNLERLWVEATRLLPHEDCVQSMPRYTQGLMDLGAQICLPRKPQCLICPVAAVCKASLAGDSLAYPVHSRKLKRSAHAWWLLILQRADGRIWLQKRPDKGIWAGLYAPPVFASETELHAYVRAAQNVPLFDYLPSFSHVLTHKDLQLHPVIVQWEHTSLSDENPKLEQQGHWQELQGSALTSIGLPAPIRGILHQLETVPST